MRVLHLPTNICSQIQILVRSQRDLGIDARGLVLNNSVIQSVDGVDNLTILSKRRFPLRASLQTLAWWYQAQAALRWADVVHWHYDRPTLPLQLDLLYLAWRKKACLAHFWGSDIRIPEIATRDNPYLGQLMAQKDHGYNISRSRSRKTQASFAHAGFACLVVGPETPNYIIPDLFPSFYRSEVALLLSDFVPLYPDPHKSRPLVVHVPSRLVTKGTTHVMRAIEALKGRFDFDFELIHNVPHGEAMEIISRSDIVLDQFIIGSFGTLALEAMALGKPALCYLTPSVLAQLPQDLPFINANPDNLTEVLAHLLTDGAKREEMGRKGRAHVERTHDAHQVARQLVTIYRELLERQGKGPRFS